MISALFIAERHMVTLTTRGCGKKRVTLHPGKRKKKSGFAEHLEPVLLIVSYFQE